MTPLQDSDKQIHPRQNDLHFLINNTLQVLIIGVVPSIAEEYQIIDLGDARTVPEASEGAVRAQHVGGNDAALVELDAYYRCCCCDWRRRAEEI